METYKLRLNMTDGTFLNWERSGKGIEETLAATKKEASIDLGHKWTGGIAIFGNQGNSGIQEDKSWGDRPKNRRRIIIT